MKVGRVVTVVTLVAAAGSGLSACTSSASKAGSPAAGLPTSSPSISASAAAATSAAAPSTTALTVGIPTDKPLPAALPSTEVFTLTNSGPAITGADVELAFGKPRTSPGDGLTGLKLERLDAASGAWVDLPVSDDASSPGIHLSTYKADIPAGTSTEQLKITATADVPVDFKVVAGGTALVEQKATVRVAAPVLAVVTAPKTALKSGSTEFDFTLTNSTTATYPAIDVNLNINCGTATIACNMPGGHMATGFKVDWYDGSAWKPLNVAGTAAAPDAYVTKIESGPLAPGTLPLKLRLSFGPDLDPRAATGDLQILAGLPFTGVGMPSSLASGDSSAMFSIK
jgi:hypothetical protein